MRKWIRDRLVGSCEAVGRGQCSGVFDADATTKLTCSMAACSELRNGRGLGCAWLSSSIVRDRRVYSLHKPTHQARVRIAGRDIYLGPLQIARKPAGCCQGACSGREVQRLGAARLLLPESADWRSPA